MIRLVLATPARAALLPLVLLVGCAPLTGPPGAGAVVDGPGDRARAAASVGEAVRDLPRSRRGNMAEYTVLGRRYRTLDSAAGFRERGIASWYGSKFHGRDTSSGEPFDMYAMTAAHRHLPLPTFVRVSDVRTGASVIVKVNDRGPFVGDRVIDLSYAAALHLGMLESGTAEVTIEALSADPPAGTASADGAPAGGVRTGAAGPAFVQLGAFADDANARALARRAAAHVSPPPDIGYDAERALYRVRLGPIADAPSLRRVLEGLSAAGIDGYTVWAPPR